MNLHERQELETVLRRFGDLTTRAQLRALEVIREYLGEEVKETEADREVSERQAALGVMRQVADELHLPEGQSPTSSQFDEVSKRLGIGWSTSRVVRAWGRWRFACEAFIGHRVRKSARQKAILEANTGKRRAYENYLTAVRLWLNTNPPIEEITAYDAWTREFNDDLPDDQPPVPLWSPIYSNLRVSFADVLRVARGEAELGDCHRRLGDHRSDRGPLVSTNWIAGEHDLSEHQARHITHRPDFPKPVVKLSGTRAWLKTDVEAYFDDRPFPKRKEYELQEEFLSLAELAALMGKPPERLKSQTMRRPEPAGLVSRRRYWRKSEAERWLKENGRPARRKPTQRAEQAR
jgi:hypothetical protein